VIEPADLIWREGQPFSNRYGDIYHAPDGSDEVERVFLAPAGFGELLSSRDEILVGELGFGTGLNFAVCARHCLAASVRLHFVSVEAAPIAPDAFAEISRRRRESEPVYDPLAERYPPLIHGWHQRRLFGGRIRLSVFWGDADRGLDYLATGQRRPFDLWLLDGFAPDRNPGMWSPELLGRMAETCGRGSRVTTFTAAGRVRRALAEAGFAMRRVDQRPHKRESLAGVFEKPGREPVHRPGTVTVFGSGLAGAATARELADSDVDVELIESAPTIAAGASRIPITVMHPRLHHDGGPVATLKATAYAHAVAACRDYLANPATGLQRRGALQFASSNFPEDRLRAVAERYGSSGLGLELLGPDDATARTGIPTSSPALWFPDACVVNTPLFCRFLLEHPRIHVHTGRELDDWPEGPAVLACGFAAQAFPGAEFLELGRVHGQLDLVRPARGSLGNLASALVGEGYVAPHTDEDLVAAGATYEYEPWPVQQASERNYEHLRRLGVEQFEASTQIKATRSVSSDRNPIIGNLFSLEGERQPDRLVSTGHGSMGTVTTHLAASVLHASLNGDITPVADSLEALISPLRFRTRQARRGYRFGARP
jgi:tRNA 5-methylaminomethyl-2-thiouridine biosynthesis bifunctional protein